MKKIVIAIDSFKGSVSSAEANAACAEGIADVFPNCKVERVTLADGGEGTVYAVATNVPGGVFHSCDAHDPLGRPRQARYYTLPDQSTAVIETADCAGLAILSAHERNPWITSSYGLGESIADAINNKCTRIIVGLGGSATNDAGTGMMQALGYRFFDKEGLEIREHGGQILGRIASIEKKGQINDLDNTKIIALCDVNNPLVGPMGATSVFGPQKGADKNMLCDLESGMETYAAIIGSVIAHTPGAGAAGGLGAAMLAYLNASLRPGIETILSLANFGHTIEDTDLIITGEGKIDRSTFMGKGPFGILRAAHKQSIPVLAIAGSISDDIDPADFCDMISITPDDMPLHIAMRKEVAIKNIRRAISAYLRNMHPHS